MTQAQLRDRAAAKFDHADRMLFTRDGLEQASAQPLARHRAARFPVDGAVLDLCCGIGGDAVELSAGRTVVAVDREPAHARLARHNVRAHGRDCAALCADVRDLRPRGAAVFVDPARREAGRRLRAGTVPPLSWCLTLAESVPRVAVKAAPGLALAVVPPGWEVEFVAVRRELREAVLWSPAWAVAARRATVFTAAGPQTLDRDPDAAVPVAAPGRFLLDPSPAVTRAGAVQTLGVLTRAWKVDERIAFLSGDGVGHTAFGRWLEIVERTPARARDVAAAMRRHDLGPADVRRRGAPGDVERFRRALPTTGARLAVVVLTRVADRPCAFVCLPVAAAYGDAVTTTGGATPPLPR